MLFLCCSGSMEFCAIDAFLSAAIRSSLSPTSCFVVLIFPQAPLEDDVHVCIPQGFTCDPQSLHIIQSDDTSHKNNQHHT